LGLWPTRCILISECVFFLAPSPPQAFTPDVMEPVEIRAFPQFYRVYETQGKWHCPRLEVYCLMRNIILGLWFQN
jgi:hypothetical protein